MKKLSLFLILTLFGITAIAEGRQTKGDAELTQAPNLVTRGPDNSGDPLVRGPKHNGRLAIAPYAQVVPNSSYTFIGISHPSLATAHTSIGLVVEAMSMTHPTQQAGNGITVEIQRAVAFTIDAGQTHRVFIVNEGHAIINPLNANINNKNTHLIITKSDETQFGNIRVTAVGTEPNKKTNDTNRTGGWYRRHVAGTAEPKNGNVRFDNLNQLAMWGVVYQESNGAGFSLEFIGDMHDSSSSGTNTFGVEQYGRATEAASLGAPHPHRARGDRQTGGSSGTGRGIN